MTLEIGAGTQVIVQGITGHQGTIHAAAMMEFGTKIVGGVSPRRGGVTEGGVPIFGTVHEAVIRTGAEASAIFVPAPNAKDAAFEAIEAGIETIVMVTEHIPPIDTVQIMQYARSQEVTVIGPNSPGIAIPGEVKIGIMPNMIFRKGNVGVVSRSGTLTYEVVQSLTDAGIGQSLCIGIGGDPVNCTSMEDALKHMREMETVDGVVLIGEIGGTSEERAAAYIKDHFGKPIVSFVAGMSAPAGKRMGHAGAMISRGLGSAEDKVRALTDAGADVATRISVIPKMISAAINMARS